MFRKTNISNPLIRTRTCAYQGVRNVSFSENFAYVLNAWPLTAPISESSQIHVFLQATPIFTSASSCLRSHLFSAWKLHSSCLLNPLSAFGCLTAQSFDKIFLYFFMISDTWSVDYQMVLLFYVSLSSVCLSVCLSLWHLSTQRVAC